MTTLRLTRTTIKVLRVIHRATSENPAWGLTICTDAGLGTARVYPLLDRMIDAGWLVRREELAERADRPKRHFYELTDGGREVVQRLREQGELL
jgi:DNA-binding MarR family transcriptional regulator